MSYMKNKINAYLEMDESLPLGASFEAKWYERVIMVLTMIRNQRIDSIKSNKLLLDICNDLSWIRNNLNPQLNAEHRGLLEQIFDISIVIIREYIIDKNLEHLDIVISSLKGVAEPYNQVLK